MLAFALLVACSAGDESAPTSVVTTTTVFEATTTTTVDDTEPEATVPAEPAGPSVPETTAAPAPDAAAMMVAFRFSDLARWADGVPVDVDDVHPVHARRHPRHLRLG
ncbi:MAG: hypothetical protein ACPHJ1_03675 [Ilumatobacteraceae bacterium]